MQEVIRKWVAVQATVKPATAGSALFKAAAGIPPFPAGKASRRDAPPANALEQRHFIHELVSVPRQQRLPRCVLGHRAERRLRTAHQP